MFPDRCTAENANQLELTPSHQTNPPRIRSMNQRVQAQCSRNRMNSI